VNLLFQNDGDGTFTKITSGAIVVDDASTLACSWADYDNDGDLDLFLAGGGNNNSLYRNDGNGEFTKITSGPIVTDLERSQGGSWGDYDNDGDLDLLVTTLNYNTTSNNFLYQNNGDGTFTKITEGVIVTDRGTSIGSSWGDYDNDGDLDLFVANAVDNNMLFSNNGDGTFIRVTTGEVVNDGTFSRACISGDYDNDGDLDLFVAGEGNYLLYANDGNSNSWINIMCIGTLSNRSAIGTKIRVKATIKGRPTWQLREISTQTGRRIQNSLNAEFGLGDATLIDSLKIEWPSGLIQIFDDLPVNQFLTMEEGGTPTRSAINETVPAPQTYLLHQNYPNPFNPSTVIRYEVPVQHRIVLSIYNVLGTKIKTLLSKIKEPGTHEIEWSGKNEQGNPVPSGIYLYRLEAAQFSTVRKMILVR
jgi:hypothetical protein